MTSEHSPAVRPAATLPFPLVASDFSSLLEQEFKPGTDEARDAVEAAVRALAEQALVHATAMTDDACSSIAALISRIDEKLSEQIDLVLHAPEFQQMESAWRGMHYLVHHTETDEKLKIRVLDVSKDELRRTVRRHRGIAWDQGPLFKHIHEDEYGVLGGEPYGCLVGDYFFDHTPADVELLSAISRIAAAAHVPFIAGAAPSLLGMESWQELAAPCDLARITSNPEHAAWTLLRETGDARYVGLAMPRFLARLPYGAQANPVDAFDYEEQTDGADHRKFVWINAAYAMAVNINRSFRQYGWCTMIRGVGSGGTVENLPRHSFPGDDGGIDIECPTEIAISDRRESEWARAGLLPLVHCRNTGHAAFIGAQSLQKPQASIDADTHAISNAPLTACLPSLFASTRFAHYLRCIVRDKVGGFSGREDMQRRLNEWITTYVDADPGYAPQETKARRPLAAAEVIVDDPEGNPGFYSAEFFLRPHFQLERLPVSLCLVAKLPSLKQPG